jgi:hypothetical protein
VHLMWKVEKLASLAHARLNWSRFSGRVSAFERACGQFWRHSGRLGLFAAGPHTLDGAFGISHQEAALLNDI